MVELNPQIGKSLVPMKESPDLIYGFFCIHKDVDSTTRQAIMKAGRALGREVEGKQILTLFRFDAVEPYKPEYIKSAIELLREYDDLKKRGHL